MTSNELNTGWRLVNSWLFHDFDSGFLKWKPRTPDHVKNLEKRLIQEETDGTRQGAQ